MSALANRFRNVLFPIVYLAFGLILAIVGNILASTFPFNYLSGYATAAIGFALVIFAVNRLSSFESEERLDQVLTKLDLILNQQKRD